MGESINVSKMKKVKYNKMNQKNKKFIKEEKIDLNQLEINQKNKRENKKENTTRNLSFEFKNNNIFSNKTRKNFINKKSIQKIQINFHIKLRRFYFLILFIILFIKFSSIFCSYNPRDNFLKSSEITLKLIQGIYQNRILQDNFFENFKPYEIYINGSHQETIKNIYDYPYNSILIFKIKWKITITNTNNMFKGCSHIKEIDLSSFDTSHVNTMKSMFQGCSGLNSLSLSNFITNKVTDMGLMFYECS